MVGKLRLSELKRYVEHHKKFGNAVKIDPDKPFISSQLLMFFPRESNQFELFKEKILLTFPELSVIRTTSPLNPDYTWMEIFPNGVSKAHGIEEICRLTGIDQKSTLGIGNDLSLIHI